MTEITQSLDTIAGMLRQEIFYHPQAELNSPRLSAVGMASRGKMLTFYYTLLKRVGSRRETAEIALSHLDRFLASSLGWEALRNKKLFHLASTTCLYVAVKMHENKALPPKLLADLSRGIFTAQDVEAMEILLAQKLQWRLNPPTSLSFVRHYLELLPLTQERKHTVYDLARHQTELALEDPRLFCEKKSLMAYLAVQNALQRLHVSQDLSDTVGALLLSPEQRSSYHCASLQSILQMALSSKLAMVTPSFHLTPPSPLPPQSWNSSSCPRTVSPPPLSHYRRVTSKYATRKRTPRKVLPHSKVVTPTKHRVSPRSVHRI